MHVPSPVTRLRSPGSSLLLLSLFAGLLLAALSFLPPTVKNALHTHGSFHLWLHLAAFAALTLLFLRSTENIVLRLLLIAAAALLGVGIEYAQAAVYGYALERLDIVADNAGVLVGMALAMIAEGIAPAQARRPAPARRRSVR